MSALRDSLAAYVALRRALGTKLKEPAATLGQFVTFLEKEGATFITTERAIRWAKEHAWVQRDTWARRLSMVRGFASWLSTQDPRTQIPPARALKAGRRRRKSYIYTDEEIGRLMAEASRMHSRTGLRARTYETLLGLLAATGLRPGEALALDRNDVDLDNAILTIRQTKFGKTRFVPIETSTCAALTRYATERDNLCPQPHSDAFLLSVRGSRLVGCSTRSTFVRLSYRVGLRSKRGTKRYERGPRLQDFRHTFATRKLIEWYSAGVDVARELPTLSTYLGHVLISDTYWYLQAIPELLQRATDYLVTKRKAGTP